MVLEIDDSRPWGKFEVLLDEPNYKVKRITIKPKSRLSLQYHKHRNEVWIIVQGEGIITRGDEEIPGKKGMHIDIPAEYKHRIENTGEDELVFIEVQTGTYFGEDDIIRIQDDYNRV